MLPFGWTLRTMKAEDLDDVLKIIYDHDEDDGECAEASYERYGFFDDYVLENEGRIAGVTGFKIAPDTENTFWLSWTYLEKSHQGKQMGTRMMEQLIEILKSKKARKIFVSTSDYIDPEEGSIYQDAIRLYKNMGFKEEIIHSDFYEPGESQLIYGRHLQQGLPPKRVKWEKRGIVLDDLYEIDETDDIYAVEWKAAGKVTFSPAEMNALLEKAKGLKARAVYMALPSNVKSANDPLKACGFQPMGMLEDFFKDGVHKIHFRYQF